MDVGRGHPHAYPLMFSLAAGQSPEAMAAISSTHDQFLAIVADVIGDREDPRPIGGLLMASVHGFVGMENSGHLSHEKWHANGDQLLRMLISRISTHA